VISDVPPSGSLIKFRSCLDERCTLPHEELIRIKTEPPRAPFFNKE